jgi:2-amino-4-hydroxy-6-hydroxymethyldihydropteridine diphosphokinase
MTSVYIGIGSNLGDRQVNCLRAVERMDRMAGCRITGCSDWFLTKPVGVEGQEWYVNGVASLTTDISPQDLLKRLLRIEADMGRVRRERWGPRNIDLDILLFGQEIIHEPDLKIPHPRMHLRRFVLEPMTQLAPDLIHPGLGLSIKVLLKKLPGDDQVVTRMKGS